MMSYSIVAHVTLLQRYFGHLARTLDHPDSCVETLPAVPRVMSSAAMPPAPPLVTESRDRPARRRAYLCDPVVADLCRVVFGR